MTSADDRQVRRGEEKLVRQAEELTHAIHWVTSASATALWAENPVVTRLVDEGRFYELHSEDLITRMTELITQGDPEFTLRVPPARRGAAGKWLVQGLYSKSQMRRLDILIEAYYARKEGE